MYNFAMCHLGSIHPGALLRCIGHANGEHGQERVISMNTSRAQILARSMGRLAVLRAASKDRTLQLNNRDILFVAARTQMVVVKIVQKRAEYLAAGRNSLN
jgi:hypothetical protein